MHPENIKSEIVQELVSFMESGFEVGKEGNSSMAVTGEPFIKLAMGGILEEGEAPQVICRTVEKAIELFKYEWKKHVAAQNFTPEDKPVLYWRKKPAVISDVRQIASGFD